MALIFGTIHATNMSIYTNSESCPAAPQRSMFPTECEVPSTEIPDTPLCRHSKTIFLWPAEVCNEAITAKKMRDASVPVSR